MPVPDPVVPLQITPLSPQDARLADLFVACGDYFVSHHGVPPHTETLAMLLSDVSAEKRARDVHILGVVTPDQALVGICLMIRDWDYRHQWCLRLMLVHPAYRNRGLGRLMYGAVSGWAKTKGAQAMIVGVLASNAGAERFWQRLGFQEIRRQTFPEYGDAMDMEQVFPFVSPAPVQVLDRLCQVIA